MDTQYLQSLKYKIGDIVTYTHKKKPLSAQVAGFNTKRQYYIVPLNAAPTVRRELFNQPIAEEELKASE